MKRKARIQTGIDDRLVAIYARKSRITNKGDSIGVQFKQSADYAINQLSLPEDYEFARYEDKGLSGYYSDRPDFQRLLRDIEMGKIKAVACYKLDRISRKTSDLMRLLEYFERHDVTLLVCSNNINTRISTSKIIIQVLAIIAEFERDILTERIQDNLMELAKDGRWLGGKTPTGFSSQRVTTGSGKNKSAISFLVPVQEEKEIVLEIYGTFWETRSLLQTANIINEKYETKHGAKFTTSAIRLILRNPIYCVADEYSYNYFLEHDGNLFGEPSDFDGQHGLTAYNKTDQMKVEDEDSTFFNPKFSQLLTRKPISEWIVSVGRHEGFISSRKWVETQNMLDEIAEKYNRPHRKTNALLSGLMYCPICGKRLRVLPESNRWTNGKPRFKYACPGVRAKECTFKGVEGVTLDEFVIHSLSSLQEEHSDYYRQLLENRVASMIRTDQSEKEYQETKKAIERLNADIAAQVRNLREADDALKRFIQDDIKELTDELAKREAALRRMEDTQSENQYLIHELNGMKKRLLSFEEFAKGAQPEALFTLVHSIVDRIYITTDGTKQKCQVYIKGCATEDYSDVLGAAGYIEEEPLLPVASYVPPMCDLDYYSIFYISIVNRIQYFGQLRTIGTTEKQIKRIVNREGTLLFCAGAPLGLAIGSLFAWILNTEGWSWINFLIWGGLTIIVEYFAVLYSIRKPAQIASKVSPIEAYTTKGTMQNLKAPKHKFRKITPFTMAKMNTSRNRKKFIMTSLSLAISGIIFMVGSTFLASFNQEAYARNGMMEYGEVRIYLSENAAQVNEQGYSGVQVDNPLNETLIQEISDIDGVNRIIAFEKLYGTFEYNGRREDDYIVPITINLDRKAGQPVRLSLHLVPKLQ